MMLATMPSAAPPGKPVIAAFTYILCACCALSGAVGASGALISKCLAATNGRAYEMMTQNAPSDLVACLGWQIRGEVTQSGGSF